MAQMAFLDTSPKPTKKYIGSLFRSEGLVCRSDQIEICQTGWIDAQNDTDKIRKEQTLRMQNSIGIQRWNGYRVDVYCLGYVTFVYGYTDAMQEIGKEVISMRAIPGFETAGSCAARM